MSGGGVPNIIGKGNGTSLTTTTKLSQISGIQSYQNNRSPGSSILGFDVNKNAENIAEQGLSSLCNFPSKLDPNSKPFSPRKMPFAAAVIAGRPKNPNSNGVRKSWNVENRNENHAISLILDENENKVDYGGDRDDKLRQIWSKTVSSPPPASSASEEPPGYVADHSKAPW